MGNNAAAGSPAAHSDCCLESLWAESRDSEVNRKGDFFGTMINLGLRKI